MACGLLSGTRITLENPPPWEMLLGSSGAGGVGAWPPRLGLPKIARSRALLMVYSLSNPPLLAIRLANAAKLKMIETSTDRIEEIAGADLLLPCGGGNDHSRKPALNAARPPAMRGYPVRAAIAAACRQADAKNGGRRRGGNRIGPRWDLLGALDIGESVLRWTAPTLVRLIPSIIAGTAIQALLGNAK